MVQTALGPKLLLLSLTAAMFGRMRSFGLTVVGGIVVGVLDALFVTWAQAGEVPTGSNVFAVFVLLLVLMLVAGRSAGMGSDDWSLTPRLKAASEELRAHPLYKASTLVGIGLLVLGALLLPTFLDKPTDFLRFSVIPIYLIVALSATVLTGWGGSSRSASSASPPSVGTPPSTSPRTCPTWCHSCSERPWAWSSP